MGIIVAISTTDDGSMFNRDEQTNPDIIAHRKKFLNTHGISLEQSTRFKITFDTHDFCRYKEVRHENMSEGMRDALNQPYDAIVTTQSNHALFLPVADCVGAVFYDPIHRILGLAHLGRHSLEQQGGMRFVSYLKNTYGSEPMDLKVWLGPAPGKDVYPIWALQNKGMKEVTHEQLHTAGILTENIIDNTAETDKDKRYFSHSEFLKGHRTNDGDHAVVAMMTD